ncbi:YmaF family protein [Virgibacillus alimentarius]|uniref:YmaF family protein n=1 Tax=Virgibacillus alimentarius TaxID=698769 RepID=A0ABS4S8M8_9BACI|nr:MULTISPECIES: YmaF family protein [Virgibacillus]MBP2257853.1 hypothetical protein [Virgibacillus alimentarius]HLR66577.1 YmaF family protein [Virgibacillus sp.]
MVYGMNPNPYITYNQTHHYKGLRYPFNLNHPDGLPRTIRKGQKDKKIEQKGHTHAHSGATTCQDGHTHLHPGVTSTPIHTKDGHVHKIWGNTTFDDEHIHYYEDYTGPPIPLSNGYHTHYVKTKTTTNDGHVHVVKGFIEPSKS